MQRDPCCDASTLGVSLVSVYNLRGSVSTIVIDQQLRNMENCGNKWPIAKMVLINKQGYEVLSNRAIDKDQYSSLNALEAGVLSGM